MIAASDLRVGNWVYDGEHTQFPMFIVILSDAYVYLDFYGREGDIWESTPDDLQGIPLTGELLEKLGFTFKDGLWRHEWGVKVKPEKGFVNIENKDKEHWLYGTCNCKDVWYLHQLQNVISVITKKELLIKF